MMQYDNNDIDKKLRQLDNQSLPDLSKMDEQWENMKASLVPAVQPGSQSFFRIPGFCIIAAVFIGALFFLFYINNQKQVEPKKEYATLPVLTDTPSAKISDSLVISQRIIIKNPAKIKFPAYKIIPLQEKLILDTQRVPELLPVKDSKKDKAALEKFFKELEKPAQEFVINPNRDTMITGKDGSVLLILANTFASPGEVKIVLREYYTYKDIITNRLTTVSNNQQLISGGMLHISAMADGKEINMQPSKSIRWFIPDTSAEIKKMQLFTGIPATTSKSLLRQKGGDTIASITDFVSYNDVSWQSESQYFDQNYLMTRVKVLDTRNTPIRRRSTKKGEVGIFRLSDDPKANKEELQQMLKDQYGYYKVKIKGNAPLVTDKKRGFFKTVRFGSRQVADGVGDSIWIPESEALSYKLKYDTKRTTIGGNMHTEFVNRDQRMIKEALYDTSLNSLSKRYSVELRTLGWINCDRFMNDNRNKIYFYVDLKDTASRYYSILVFDKIKSMMPGATSGNMIRFSNLPEGETATIISVGIENGKVVSASKTLQISTATVTDLKFEEVTPAGFKEQVRAMDK